MVDWNLRYESDDTPWDKGGWTPVLNELIQKKPEYFRATTLALVPGCGMGHDVMPLVEAGLHVTGMDISALAVQRAEALYGSSSKLEFVLADLFHLSTDYDAKYDLVWEHTCYCAIHPSQREEYVDVMSELLKPGAYFTGVFFTNTSVPIEEGPPFETSRDDAYANFKRKFDLVWEGKPESGYEGRVGREWLMIWRNRG